MWEGEGEYNVVGLVLPTHVHRVRSLESGKESDVSIWKKRAEAAEKSLVSKEREILDAREVVSPSSSSSYHCCLSALVSGLSPCPICRPSTLRKR